MKSIQEVTGDDTSMSLVGLGFESFTKFKSMMMSQSVSVVGNLRNMEENIIEQRQKLEKLQHDYGRAINSGWESYKQKYLKYINEDGNGNA